MRKIVKSLDVFRSLFVVGVLGLLVIYSNVFSQTLHSTASTQRDKCGYDEVQAMHLLSILGDHWGYGYDSLLVDLQRWQQSPYVTVDSLGASVQNRALWQLTITADYPTTEPRRTVFIHARTHPSEVQAFWVTNEIINLLRSEDEFAQLLRDRCTFYILPMYNPDGVELEYPRENAHGVDIESNWYANQVEPEVNMLRSRFAELMASDAPIEAALNLHSAFACKRYFVYHDAAGTSSSYTVLEKNFIGGVRSYFMEGMEPWVYFISWKSGTPLLFPESWFWLNFHEDVMALTYEDMNCDAAGKYDRTAFALLHGVSDYLGVVVTSVVDAAEAIPDNFDLLQNYPNPVRLSKASSLSTIIQYSLQEVEPVRLVLYDILGRQVKVLDAGVRDAATHRVFFNASNLPAGSYFYRLQTAGGVRTRQLIIMK